MILRSTFSLLLFLTVLNTTGFSQTITRPAVGLRSHETLEIKKIEISGDKTVIFLSIENQIEGGYFCADRNIILTYPDGSGSKIISSSGIPVCPDSFKFKALGEKLDFILTFPALKTGTGWIDIIEDCSENCFSFYGVTLDNNLNTRIEEVFNLAEKKEIYKAVDKCENLLESIKGENLGIEGGLYCDIITLLIRSGNNSGAMEWYRKMISSKAVRLDQYIKNLNSRGIKY
jgi:hypothetical protein